MLQVTVEHSSDTAILHCVGRIVAGCEADVLKENVMSQCSRRTVILDLAGIDTIDAGGLGVLVFLHTFACLVGFEFKLMQLSDRVRELLAITRLDSVFETVSESVEPPTGRTTAPANTRFGITQTTSA
jgi:anti-sigma B factor antagonist